MRIGYQGDVGSNSEAAALGIVKGKDYEEAELIPLISSMRVMDALENERIDCGVMAVRNSVGGMVRETQEVLNYSDIDIVDVQILPIKHSLFVRDGNVCREDIEVVCSHIQALKQCEKSLRVELSGVSLMEIEDTALGAKRMKHGEIGRNMAVLCRKNAGMKYGLHMLYENMADEEDNRTEFVMVRKKKVEKVYNY